MKKLIITLLIISIGFGIKAQNFEKQRGQFIISNIGINGFVGGIGALVNKKKGEKPAKVFLKGFCQGSLGGTFQFLGKELTYEMYRKENISYAWAARITNSIGSSITQNAASNINFWERWHMNIGILRFDYFVKDKKIKARFFPSSVYGVIMSGRQAKLNFKKTFQTGIMIYERDGNLSALNTLASGFGFVSSIAINKNIKGDRYYGLMAHEVMHILQYDNMIWLNPFFNKVDKKFKTDSKLYNKISKHVYFDLNGLTILGFYLAQINRTWECRFLEREADHFSRRVHWPICN